MHFHVFRVQNVYCFYLFMQAQNTSQIVLTDNALYGKHVTK
jgi:hypothetical protein